MIEPKDILVVLILVSGGLSPLSAQDVQRLTTSTTFRCTFSAAASANMDGDSPSTEVRVENFELIFDQINRTAGTGRMIGNAGGTDVHVIPAFDGLTLVEPLGSGFLHVTAIYASQNSDLRYKAVHSRHTAMFGSPVPSQYYGACVAML